MTKIPSDPAERAAVLESIAPDEARSNHELLRSILRSEIQLRRETGPGPDFENLYHCAFLLFCVGDPEDVPTLWSAKQIDFDTGCAFDIQFLLGAGTSRTLAFLESKGEGSLAKRLSAHPDFNDDLSDWYSWRKSYFYPT